MSNNNRKKQNELNLNKKVEVIKYLNDGNSERKAAEKFNISKGSVNNIKNRSDEYLRQFNDEGISNERIRKIPKTEHAEINDLSWKWFKRVRVANVPITGSMLKEIAQEIAAKLNMIKFQASDGWIERFKKRHLISFNVISGEELSNDHASAEEFKQKLPSICEGYTFKIFLMLMKWDNTIEVCQIKMQKVKNLVKRGCLIYLQPVQQEKNQNLLLQLKAKIQGAQKTQRKRICLSIIILINQLG